MDNSQLKQTLGIQVRKKCKCYSLEIAVTILVKKKKIHTVVDIHTAGYQIGRPLIAGVVQALGNNTDVIQRTSIDLWKPGNLHLPISPSLSLFKPGNKQSHGK